MADCLRDVRSKVEDIKFLGSYPAGEHGPAVRRDAEEAWRTADAWIKDQKAKLSPRNVVPGAVAEWTKATVLKVVDRKGPWVRIPPAPPPARAPWT